ncbi:MAG: hypothetical protein CVU08_08425 [Bacteroidetes bacterium HGW-Bacteroidetes-3]|jgi:hypothetical protein|nr:MAG: hypothetical protein CVU08_08425 [Bacteroidetes bacterium HGW-Bacteroidetes-3]
MEITGKITKIKEAQTFGASGFRKRELVVTTNEQYPQPLMVEFVQDKCDLLNAYQVGQDVKISINLRGREWINPQGEAVYFNSIQGWRIEVAQSEGAPGAKPTVAPAKFETTTEIDDSEPDDLPF